MNHQTDCASIGRNLAQAQGYTRGDTLSEPSGDRCSQAAEGVVGVPKNLTFGQALEWLKTGRRVARAGWNGRGMFVYMNRGSDPSRPDERAKHLSAIRSDLFDYGDNGTIRRLPNLNMRAADGSTVTGWLASQTDMLAEDWMLA